MKRRPDRSRPDFYAKKAKEQGFAARSVFKLEEMDQRFGLLRPGQRVLDLGCAPGSWLQFAANRVGPKGQAIGIDLKPVSVPLPAWATAYVGDAFTFGEATPLGLADVAHGSEAGSAHAPLTSGSFDLVLSDMAPATTGDRGTDAARSAALAERAFEVALVRLRLGGHFVVKLLEGGDTPKMLQDLRREFRKVELLRPKATRRESTEIFLIGLGRKESLDVPARALEGA